MILRKYVVRIFVEDDHYEGLDETGRETLEEVVSDLGIVSMIEEKVNGRLARDPDLNKIWARADVEL